MAREYLSRAGDTVDLIAFLEFGREAGVVEEMLTLNPQLANEPAVLPYGVRIVLPDAAAVANDSREEPITLW